MRSVALMFRQGLYTNLLNPKMAMFVLVMFPQFIDPAAGNLAVQIMILATVLNLIGFVVKGVVILTASKASDLLTSNRRFKSWSRYVLGIVFAGLAARLAFDSAR